MSEDQRNLTKIGFIIVEDFEALDITGPRSVFAIANEQLPRCQYQLFNIGLDNIEVTGECGLKIKLDFLIEDSPSLDFIIFPGGKGYRKKIVNPEHVKKLTEMMAAAKRVASICTGAYLLAELGVLDGYTSAIHWNFADDFRKKYSNVTVDGDSLYCVSGKFWTSGGITAGIDMCLNMIATDLSEEIAANVSRMLNVYIRRAGHQAQFSIPLSQQLKASGGFKWLIDWLIENPEEDASIKKLAEMAATSERTFVRRLKRQMNETPAKLVERVRLDMARQLLDVSEAPIDSIAYRVGFKSLDSFSRAFERNFNIRPSVYRQFFRKEKK
jgi:transcriptional regulator GlxA family with amidase domain